MRVILPKEAFDSLSKKTQKDLLKALKNVKKVYPNDPIDDPMYHRLGHIYYPLKLELYETKTYIKIQHVLEIAVELAEKSEDIAKLLNNGVELASLKASIKNIKDLMGCKEHDKRQ